MTTSFLLQDIATAQNGNLDAVRSLGNLMLEAGNRITLLNLELARNSLAHAAVGLRASMGEEGGHRRPVQPLAREAATYFRNFAHLSAETQVEVARLVQSHLSNFGKSAIALLDRVSRSENNVASALATAAMKSAIATATASCQSLTESTQRATEMAEANTNALADSVQSMSVEQDKAAKELKKLA